MRTPPPPKPPQPPAGEPVQTWMTEQKKNYNAFRRMWNSS